MSPRSVLLCRRTRVTAQRWRGTRDAGRCTCHLCKPDHGNMGQHAQPFRGYSVFMVRFDAAAAHVESRATTPAEA